MDLSDTEVKQGRKPKATGPARIERQQRTSQILQMRLTGWTLQQIGDVQDPPVSPVAIFKTITKALKDMVLEPFQDEARALELLRLDELLVGVYGKAKSGDLAAVDACLAISTRRARLLGLDIVRSGRFSEEPFDPANVRLEIVSVPDPSPPKPNGGGVH